MDKVFLCRDCRSYIGRNYKKIYRESEKNLIEIHPTRKRVGFLSVFNRKMLGVSSQKIGKLSNEHNMKTDEFGKWFYDKSRHSNKEVDTFRYYEKAIGEFKKLLNIS